jgi:short-subunit dehydrogenase
MSRRPFAATYGPWALVAGGSEGLGAAFADEIGRRGVNLVLVARRPGKLAEEASRLRRAWEVEVETIAADLAAPDAAEEIAAAIAGRPVGLVVANAALAPAGPFLSSSTADVMGAVDLNCRAAALLAHRFLPPMVERGHGGLILMSSLAGLQGVQSLAVYGATKAFLISLAEALWAETRPAGVDVLASCPGAVTTPGYQQAARRPAPGATTPAQVAVATLDALGRGFRVVPGRLNRVNAFALSRLMPRRAAIAVFGRATVASLNETGGEAGAETTAVP